MYPQFTEYPQPVRDIAFSPPKPPIEYDPVLRPINQPGNVLFDDLPQDILIELLVNLPPDKLASLCGTSVGLSKLCNNEGFLRQLINRRYGVTVGLVPGQTIKEKYTFMTQFDPRYFTDPDFVKVSQSYKEEFGLDYTSRRNPNDALNTIISILNDSLTTEDINVLKISDADVNLFQRNFPGVTPGKLVNYSSRLTTLLSGAIMTKSRLFANEVILNVMDRISPDDLGDYQASLRYPFILSIEYGMESAIHALKYYYNPSRDLLLKLKIFEELIPIESIDVFDRFVPYLTKNHALFWTLVNRGRYDLADHILIRLRSGGMEIFNEQFGRTYLRKLIDEGNVDKIRYLMKYMTPSQRSVDYAIKIGRLNIARILQGQDIEEDMDIDQ